MCSLKLQEDRNTIRCGFNTVTADCFAASFQPETPQSRHCVFSRQFELFDRKMAGTAADLPREARGPEMSIEKSAQSRYL